MKTEDGVLKGASRDAGAGGWLSRALKPTEVGGGGVLGTPIGFAAVAMILVVLGSLALLPLWIHISGVWWMDSLRAIGATFPLISLVGVMAAWRRLGWTADGSLWGLLPIILSIQLARFVNVTPLFNPYQIQYWWVVHAGPVLFLYGVGAALLFGGWRLLRTVLLPLCLLLCINPVPSSFNLHFDMPLQEIAAGTARAFAHLIGLHPNGAQLRMMFSPDFGMLIVPGCNGIRGSITLAYLAAIYGYTRRLRLGPLALVALVALLTGYALNLLRLCVLVVYYRLGLSFPAIQSYGTQVDYAIGCTIFFGATIGLGYLIRWIGRTRAGGASTADTSWPLEGATPGEAARVRVRPFLLRTACFLVISLIPIARARGTWSTAFARPVNEQQLARSFPATVGSYKLVKTSTERQYSGGGVPLFLLGEYADPNAASGATNRIVLGLFLTSGYHRVVDSKAFQGSRPQWTGALDGVLASSQAVHYGVSFYDDGETRQFNAETVCSEVSCTNPLVDYDQFSLSRYAGPHTGKHLPVLLRMEWPESEKASTVELRSRFEVEVLRFSQQLDVTSLVAAAGTTQD